MENVVYLDHNATSVTKILVCEAIEQYHTIPLNASSTHQYGRMAKKLINQASESILNALGGESKDFDVIFTSGATEANNLVVKGLSDSKFFCSNIEHDSLLKLVESDAIIPVDQNGLIRLDVLEEKLDGYAGKAIVSCMLANNETGVINNLKAISKICQKYGALLHSDLSQALCRMEVNILDLGLDFITISGHKCGGPQGIGALIKKKLIRIDPQIIGGGQQGFARAGTENIAAIHGFGVACQSYKSDVKNFQEIQELRDYFEYEMKKLFPEVVFYSQDVVRLANTSYFSIKNLDVEMLAIALDSENICVSAGPACSSGTIRRSHVLEAMGYGKQLAIRVSLAPTNNKDEINKFLNVMKRYKS